VAEPTIGQMLVNPVKVDGAVIEDETVAFTAVLEVEIHVVLLFLAVA
jgi:hypothetical protein